MSARHRHRVVVAIDGPAGAGKSTAARRLTEELGYSFLDTGALYRAVAQCARERGIDWADETAVAELAEGLAVEFRLDGAINRIFVDGRDRTAEIRAPEISQGASIVSAHPAVRRALLGLQRRLGDSGGVVAEGRDIGTVVFPSAQAKFFVTASPEIRARRRHDELVASGSSATYEETLREMVERDERDSGREVAPLRQADDAILIDTTDMSLEAVVGAMAAVVRERELV